MVVYLSYSAAINNQAFQNVPDGTTPTSTGLFGPIGTALQNRGLLTRELNLGITAKLTQEGHHHQRLVRGPALRNRNIYKIYAKSFRNEQHLTMIVMEAQQIVNDALAGTGSRNR